MSRYFAILTTVILSAATASAQGFSGSRVIPGSMPNVPIPGTLPSTVPPAPPLSTGGWFSTPLYGYGGYGYGGYYPWFNNPFYYGGLYYGPMYNYGSAAPAEAAPTPPAKPQLVPGNENSAVLTVQLPVAGELWVNGQKQDGNGDLYKVRTSPIARGTEEEFAVRAIWTFEGKKYSAERKVPLGSGDRVKLTIASGTPVTGK